MSTSPVRYDPIRYDPALERAEPDEAATGAGIDEAMRTVRETTAADYGHAVRSVHAKSHALIEAEIEVLPDLPADLAQGLFARARTYPVVMRFSTNPGDVLPDSISVPQGLAIKIIGVEGDRLPGSEGDVTQDFVMANGPAFVAPDGAKFLGNLKMLSKTTDRVESLKVALSATLRGAETALEAIGKPNPTFKALGGHPQTHPLGETYYTQTAFRYGDAIAKISVAPVGPDLAALTGTIVDVAGRPDALRDTLIDHFRDGGGAWELRVQLCTDLATMPIEDASVVWPEDRSPYVAVARITAKPQPAWNEARAKAVDDGLLFSPWHGLAAHRPLGSVNRLRRDAYARSGAFRGRVNGCPMREPDAMVDLGDTGPDMPVLNSRARSAAVPMRKAARLDAGGMSPIAAGAAGAFVGGAILSAMMLATEAKGGEPSDLVKLERRSAGKLGQSHLPEGDKPTFREQAVSHGGHLALSAASGALYGALKPPGTPPLVAGLVFGAGFYGLAYGIVGPALGLTPPLSRDTRASIVQHAAFHALFGVATALVAERLTRAPDRT